MRHPTLVLAATSLFALAPLAGCDEQPHGAAQRHLDSAMQTLNQAQLGFVPDSEESSLAEYRLETLEQAVGDLRDAIAQGNQDQQVTARRLLADIHATATQTMLRDASREDAALRLRAGSVITQLGAFEQASARVDQFDRDNALTIEQLNEEIREQRASRDEAEQRRSGIEEQVEQLRQERDQLREQIDEAQAEARRLRDQAFVADGDEQYELEEEAAQVALASEQQAAEAERVEGEITLAEADLALVDERIDAIDDVVEDLQAQVEKLEQQTVQTAEWRSDAEADQEEAFELLREEYEQLVEAYHTAVRDRFEQARERADEAAEIASEAANQAAGTERRAAGADLLARRGDQVRALVDHHAAVGGLGRVLEIVVERVEATRPDAVRPFEEGLTDLIERQRRLADDAQSILANANELANELGGEESEIGDHARAQQAWLASQNERLRRNHLAE